MTTTPVSLTGNAVATAYRICRDPRGLADERTSGPAESGTVTLSAPK